MSPAAATKTAANPKTVTMKGRLSFPRFKIAEAIEANKKSKFPKANEAEVSTEFNLLLEEAQVEKFCDHVLNVFLPYCEAAYAKDPKSRDALEPKLVKKIREFVEARDWYDQPPFFPLKTITEKNQEAAPECSASLKVMGRKGADVELQATVFSEDQMMIPDPDILSYPVRMPIAKTVFTPYAGAYYAATLNLYAFFNSNANYGIGAGASIAFHMGNQEGERFGGGGVVEEDEIFAD